jgi:nucleotide-binding universal stress UspA family protein
VRAPTTILLAHHGTPGAARAEALAFELAVPGTTTILHALVVPDFWDGMQGDDWLNNASTRDTFARHLENKLAAENAELVSALKARCDERGLASRSLVAYGDPADCLVAMAHEARPELVVIGPPRAKGDPGYRSRVTLETLARGLACTLLVAR